MTMHAYVTTEKPAITGMSARARVIYSGPQIVFSGASGGKAAQIIVDMTPQQAIQLAQSLLKAADKHGQDTRSSVATVVRRLSRRLSKESI